MKTLFEERIQALISDALMEIKEQVKAKKQIEFEEHDLPHTECETENGQVSLVIERVIFDEENDTVLMSGIDLTCGYEVTVPLTSGTDAYTLCWMADFISEL